MSILLAFGIELSTQNAVGELLSYNDNAKTKDGRSIKVYFTTGKDETDYAYISLDNQIGYVQLSYLNLNNLVINNDYVEYQKDLVVNIDEANVYFSPSFTSNVITTIKKNNMVHVVAKNNDSWYVVTMDNLCGFIHESGFGVKKIMITGNDVNVRLSPTTNNKKNIIGIVNYGDIFTLISHENNWFLFDYYGKEAYVYDDYAIETNHNVVSNSEIKMIKITKCNVNIRSSPNMNNSGNIIGFADITDSFEYIDKENDWYKIKYLDKVAYIYSKYGIEIASNKDDLYFIKSVSLTKSSCFYKDTNETYYSTLPQYQYARVIKEENGYYKVCIDGIIGYIKKSDTKRLTDTFVVMDLGRQIVKVYKNNKEVFRAHLISGRKSMQTNTGIFTFGHKIANYQLTPDHKVGFWMQFNGNQGLHDATWQNDKNFVEVAKNAYERYALGIASTYPSSHGSHGCGNLTYEDASIIYDYIRVGDNIIVMPSNNLVKDKIISQLHLYLSCQLEKQKIKKLV